MSRLSLPFSLGSQGRDGHLQESTLGREDSVHQAFQISAPTCLPAGAVPFMPSLCSQKSDQQTESTRVSCEGLLRGLVSVKHWRRMEGDLVCSSVSQDPGLQLCECAPFQITPTVNRKSFSESACLPTRHR